MSLQKLNIRSIVLVLMILASASFRLLSFKFPYLLSNITPVGAIALFGGAYFAEKWKAYAVVLLTLFSTDILINYLYSSKWIMWADGSLWVYITFAIMVFIGSLIKKATVLNVALCSLASVAIHWLIIDMPWLYGTLYAHNLTGYGQSLIAALPFEKNMVLGDLIFCSILFGGFEFAKTKYTFLRSGRELAV